MSKFERIAQGAMLKRGDAEALVMMFSSRRAPVTAEFDFMNFCQHIPQTVLLLRDEHEGTYYHEGIAGLGTDVDSTCAALRDLAREFGARRVTTTGMSKGGYAAMLFGQLLRAESIIAINALSYLDSHVAARAGGGERFENSFADMHRLYARRGGAPKYLDLRALVLEQGAAHTVTRWHFGADPIDLLHAEHVRGLPGVHLIRHGDVMFHAMLGARMISTGRMTSELQGNFLRAARYRAPGHGAIARPGAPLRTPAVSRLSAGRRAP